MSAEEELHHLASGASWHLDKLSWMQESLRNVKTRTQEVRESIENGEWSGTAASVAAAHLQAMELTLQNARSWLDDIEKIIPKHSELIRERAQQEIEALPMGGLPSTVRDAIDRGQPEAMTAYGLIGLGTGPVGVAVASAFFQERREEEARKAVDRMRKFVVERSEELDLAIRTGFDRVDPSDPNIKNQPTGDRDGTSSPVTGGPGPSVPPPVGRNPGGGGPTGTGPGSGGGGSGDVGGPVDPTGPNGPDGPNDPTLPQPLDPDWPPVITDPPPFDPDGPGSDGPGGPEDPNWTDTGQRPSVDSNLDGSAVRSGLGAAGLGAAGLAAGAKLAGAGGGNSGFGMGLGAVGHGGLGAAPAGAGLTGGGGGLRGAAAAAGAGGSGGGSGASSNTAGSGRGARPGGMMMGGGAGGGAEKKSARSGLGGYIAPKLEDEGDGGPAARASRAGGRTSESDGS
ncbi:hypothetical protein [Leucobacter manosquensis]|uniref:PPE family domain-containing protein n=1 Tax=Leucobacter manosquensis TaxID=2810611 RepID=A0ABS5M7K1_9MICO|nr:hypothetical protein [Leucobacter manosquensis]MBS3183152.1 hypothetical protein [Leucobacter manosquensis]